MKQKLKNAFGGDKLILIGATVVVFAMFTLLNRNFLSWTNFVNILGAGRMPCPSFFMNEQGSPARGEPCCRVLWSQAAAAIAHGREARGVTEGGTEGGFAAVAAAVGDFLEGKRRGFEVELGPVHARFQEILP